MSAARKRARTSQGPTTKAGRAARAERNAVAKIDKLTDQPGILVGGGRQFEWDGELVSAVEWLRRYKATNEGAPVRTVTATATDREGPAPGAASIDEASLIPAGEQVAGVSSTDGSSNTLKEQLAQLTGRYAFEARELVEAHISRVLKSLGGL